MSTISDEEYERIQTTLVNFGYLIKDVDLRGFLERIDQSENIAPIINPTLFIKAEGKMAKVKSLAKAALVYQDEVRKQIKEIGGDESYE